VKEDVMPRSAARSDARTKLLEAALSVIRTKGYSAASVDELCAAAGVTKGAFFHHFKSKDELGVAAADYWSATTGALFAAAPYHGHPDPLDRVLAYVDFRKALLRGGVPLPRRHVGAGDLRDETCHPAGLRTQHHGPCRNAGGRYRGGDARTEHGA
jgi:AcrR family transcriptional regulator